MVPSPVTGDDGIELWAQHQVIGFHRESSWHWEGGPGGRRALAGPQLSGNALAAGVGRAAASSHFSTGVYDPPGQLRSGRLALELSETEDCRQSVHGMLKRVDLRLEISVVFV